MTDTVCDTAHGTPGSDEFFRCQRPTGHNHRHQELTKGVLCTWTPEGSSIIRLDPGDTLQVCTRCGVLDHLDGRLPEWAEHMRHHEVCFFCSVFLKRKAAYNAGNMFVTPDHRWVSHHGQIAGAFDGKPARLVCDTGQVFGPDTQTWDGGAIDEADQDLVPPNAHIDWMHSPTN